MVGPFLYQLQFLSVAYKKRLRSKMLFFKMYSTNSIRASIEILLNFRKSTAFHITINPSSWGILGYRPTTSIVHSVTSSGKGGRLSNLDKKSFVYLMYDLKSHRQISRKRFFEKHYSCNKACQFSASQGTPWRSYLENLTIDDKVINRRVRLFTYQMCV